MKIKTTLKWTLAAGAAATLFSSCVDTYGGGGPGYGPGYGGPAYGSYVETLPGGYVSEYYGGERYYVVNNVYYRRSGGRYIVAERPRGARPGPGPVRPGYGHPGSPGYSGGPHTMSTKPGYSGGSHTESMGPKTMGGSKPGGYHPSGGTPGHNPGNTPKGPVSTPKVMGGPKGGPKGGPEER